MDKVWQEGHRPPWQWQSQCQWVQDRSLKTSFPHTSPFPSLKTTILEIEHNKIIQNSK